MSLSQTQIIHSLADALTWFEKELGWGVNPAELNHLTGRVGELYAAMITRGQMALDVNQRGYDVVSAEGDRISVKTFTTSKIVRFNPRTFDLVDRVIILRVNVDEGEASIEELLDEPSEIALGMMREANGTLVFRTSMQSRKSKPLDQMGVESSVEVENYRISIIENGSVAVFKDGTQVTPAKPILRRFAKLHNVDILNGSGNPKNTRQLGADLVHAMMEAE